MALVVLAFHQSSGLVAADTKLDLTVAPDRLLSRALHMWEPLGYFGQVQNQGYGYLVPMGPFFLLGDLLALPGWVTQRVWWSVLLVTAFLGAVRLARLLGVDHLGARWSAGLAYALAPRLVTVLGPISAEALPLAVAPWVLLPLVLASRGAPPVRMAARSAVALLCAGAVNAVATLAVLPLCVWWLVTRSPGRQRRRLALWWSAAVALVSVWWAVPLLLLGRYSPPFVDWIEGAATTTAHASAWAGLRGVSHWIPYLTDQGQPYWAAGWMLVTNPLLLGSVAVVAVAGLAGLADPRTRERVFLLGAVLIGLVLVTAGHVGVAPAPWAEAVQGWLDGALAPFRNTHKFDAMIRLPLAIGLGLAIQRAAGAAASTRATRRRRAALVAAAATVAAVLAGALPLVLGQATQGRTFEVLPGYWEDVADWLGERGPDRALVVPSASFGTYLWGRSQDEPLQPWAQAPWAVRDAVPLSSAGNIRLLDAVDRALADGQGSAGLAEVLERSGVRWLVVRNDLGGEARAPRAVLVRQALRRSPGLRARAVFGASLGSARLADVVADDGLQLPVYPVEIWEVSSTREDLRIARRPLAEHVRYSGGPESLLDLAAAGVLQGSAAIHADDARSAGTPRLTAATDTLRRIERDMGRVRDNESESLTADSEFVTPRAVHDYLPLPSAGPQPVAVEDGYAVLASSSGSQITALRARSPASSPWSALDGDPDTAWVSGDLAPGVGQWWEVRWSEARELTTVDVRLLVGGPVGAEPRQLRIVTDTGSRLVDVRATAQPQTLAALGGSTRRLRLELAAVSPAGAGDGFGLREVSVPGPGLARPLDLPTALGAGTVAVLAARDGEVPGCVTAGPDLVCSPVLASPGEERAGVDRWVTVAEPTSYDVSVVVRPRPGAALERLLPAAGPAQVTASSRRSAEPGAAPAAAADGDPATTWVADPLDVRPRLRLTVDDPVSVDGIEVEPGVATATSRPLGLVVRADGGERTVFLDEDGTASFPALRGRSFEIEFAVSSPVRSVGRGSLGSEVLPVGVRELRLRGMPAQRQRPADTPVAVRCGAAPELRVDGRDVSDATTRTTVGAVLAAEPATVSVCSEPATVRLAAGRHRLTVASTAEWLVEQVTLVPRGEAATPARASALEEGAARIRSWEAVDRVVDVPALAAATVLETTENANAGWVAELAGERLEPVRVDGWRQGWLVPAGMGGQLHLRYAPDLPYRSALALGAVAAALVLAAAVRSREPASPSPGTPPRPGALLLGCTLAGCLLLVTGLPGLVVGLATAAASRRRSVAAWLAVPVAAVLVAATMVVRWPADADQTWVEGLSAGLVSVLLTLSVIVGAAGPAPRWLPTRLRRRGAGDVPSG